MNAWLAQLTGGSLVRGLVELAGSDDGEAFLGVTRRALGDVRRFQRELGVDLQVLRTRYGDDFFGPSVVAKATVNTLTGKLFAAIVGGGAVKSRDAINAIALLHPITDDALDKGKISPASLRKLGQYLEDGRPPVVESAYENVVFGLLADIRRDYSPDRDPWLWILLQRLHRAQVRSLAQKNGMTERDLLSLSFEKGGLSITIAAYLALGGLSAKQYELFFKSGAVFQIMDDFMDIDVDLDEGGRTVWTGAIADGRRLGPVVDRLLLIQAELERELPAIVKDFDPRGVLRRIYLHAFKLTLMQAATRHEARLTKAERRRLGRFFPISFATLRRLSLSAARGAKALPEEMRDLIAAWEAY